MTPAQVIRFCADAAPYAEHLCAAAVKFNITTPQRQAPWLANCAHESGGFRKVEESLNYKVEALLGLFSRARISEADARAYGRLEHEVNGRKVIDREANQPEIANRLYGGAWGEKNLGNIEPGDGWLYRGRGLFQSTGKDNFRRYLLDTYGTAEDIKHPELLAQPKDAAFSAGWFWHSKNLNRYADKGDFSAVCSVINTGSPTRPAVGIEDRREWFERAEGALT